MLSDLKTQSRKKTPAASPQELPGLERIFHIQFDVKGETLKASVVSRILNMNQRIARDRTCSILAGEVGFDSLPQQAQIRVFALATCSQALKDPPEWVEQWIEYSDVLLLRIFEEVNRHEAQFFQIDMEESGEETQGPTVQIETRDLDPA